MSTIFETNFQKRSVPFDFAPEFPEILVKWIAPKLSSNVLPIFVSEEAEEAKIWWNQQVQRQATEQRLSNCASHCFKLSRMVKGTESIEDISPANEAEDQNTTRASRTKFLENEHDSETSTARDRVKHRCGCRRYRPQNFLFLASRGIYGFRKCPENEEVSKSKLELE